MEISFWCQWQWQPVGRHNSVCVANLWIWYWIPGVTTEQTAVSVLSGCSSSVPTASFLVLFLTGYYLHSFSLFLPIFSVNLKLPIKYCSKKIHCWIHFYQEWLVVGSISSGKGAGAGWKVAGKLRFVTTWFEIKAKRIQLTLRNWIFTAHGQ